MHGITNQNNHIYNQNQPTERNKVRKLWDLLLDNQSTCDVIINKKLLNSVRKFK